MQPLDPEAVSRRTTYAARDVFVRFPPRRSAAVRLRQAREGVVLARGHGWLHGSRSDALETARWLARNLGFPIRELAA
jgi:hypothetical protein